MTMPTPPYSDPLAAILNRFIEDIVSPRMEETFDNIAGHLHNPLKPQDGIPKSGPHKAKQVHKAQPADVKPKPPGPIPFTKPRHVWQLIPSPSPR